MRKLLITALVIGCSFALLPTGVQAAYIRGSAGTEYRNCDLDGSYSKTHPTVYDIEQCRVDVAKRRNAQAGLSNDPFFNQPDFLSPSNFSLASWVALAATIFVLGLILYWVYLVLRAAILIIGSFGSPDKIGQGFAQIKAVLRSIAAIFIFLVILILAGRFFGIGDIWQWPASFSQCQNFDNKFYFTVRLERPGTTLDECN